MAVDTLDDMQTLFSGIDLGEVSVSMTINAPAAIMLAFYVAAAESDPAGRGPVAPERLSGTIQADILKEYIAQKEWCFPIDPAMRLCGDMIEWCTRRMPRWHPISISGYHIREAGSTAQQELAFTLKDGLTYVEQAVERGLDVDDFAPAPVVLLQRPDRLLRGDRQVPRRPPHLGARAARDVRRAGTRARWQMRFHAQTAGVSLTAQQPLNNIVRTTIEALAGVLGGTQSLHTNSYDEALALPTEEAVTIALRTQQVIAHETGVTNTVDPLGGSYFVEALTDEMEQRAYEYFAKIDELGGMVAAVKRNYPQREIADAAFTLQQEIDAGERDRRRRQPLRRTSDEQPIPTLRVDPALERKQIGRLQAARAARDGAAVERALAALRDARRARATATSWSRSSPARARTPPRARSWSPCSRSSATTPRRPSSEAVRPPVRRRLAPRAVGARQPAAVARAGVSGHFATSYAPLAVSLGLGSAPRPTDSTAAPGGTMNHRKRSAAALAAGDLLGARRAAHRPRP